ncbi:fumarate hydratase C-terminal domain-containing protein [Candidatus Bathyarchaeota archaeon]|nr:fumarate hydratase C-terminal domain-containing protein [Candidatus Bathyarchaeota archaeon]MBS7614006.1 fumarate hydratase C-terminal domain-containing protein [Candidatus Bathyarchaeota archaeon]MBS7618059.1 fumarate hydratase C-terminal domain-containing protein [Candidatus Bathyarchaeota archaeon]
MNLDITVPVEDVSNLKVGDVVYITGLVITMRDQATKRLVTYFQSKIKPPLDFQGIPVFHCGPVVKRTDKGWTVESLGPTTSARMEDLLEPFLKASGVRIIIGKGGFSEKSTEIFKRFKAVYCNPPGGASALLSKSVRRVSAVYWLDLGPPEALWLLEVYKFGPMVVAIDSHGVNIYSRVRESALKRISKIVEGRI